MTLEQYKLVMDILNGLCAGLVSYNKDGYRQCSKCERTEQWQGYGIEHKDDCPVALNNKLQKTRYVEEP